MADISKVKIRDTIYNIKDAIARAGMATFPVSGTPAALGTANNGTATTVARSDHVHAKPTYGNITTDGAITATGTIANGDKIVIVDSSDSSKIKGSTIAFDGTTESQFLTKKGTWAVPQSIPDGGKKGQILVKNSDANQDVSWYSPSDMPTSSTWYLPDGITESNVVAAYKFVGAENETQALTNVNTGTSYVLTKNSVSSGYKPIWDASNGFLFKNGGWLSNANLENSNIQGVAFGYKYTEDINASKSSVGVSLSVILYTKAWQGSSTYIKCGAGVYSGEYSFRKAAIEYERGVLACNSKTAGSYYNYLISGVYLNGMPLSVTQHSAKINTNNQVSYVVIGQNPNRTEATTIPAYVTALVFYNVELTASQHAELYENIKALGGGID